MNLLNGLKKQVTQQLIDQYFQLARSNAAVGWAHNELRRLRHRTRYGVDSAFMFHAVELEVNSMCNRRCGYCPNSFARRPSGYMKDALFRKIIDELAEMNFDGRISYHFYGEPLLDKRLPEFVSYSKSMVPRSFVEIYSNGDFLNVGLFREYLGRGLDNFLITQHDNEVPPNLQEILDQASEEERRRIVIRFPKDRNIINRSGLIQDLEKSQMPMSASCNWPLSIMVITLSGNVVLCCNDYFESEVVGSVEERSLREVWTGERYTAFRDALSRGDRWMSPLCHKCDYVPEDKVLRRVVPST